MIRLRNVEKHYQTGHVKTFVLRRVDVDIAEGEFVTVMGPSGAGKSTLMAIVGMLDAAWEGEYYFLDQPVHKLKPKERAALNKQYIGFVFQSYHLIDSLTVAENLDLPLSYRDVKKAQRQALVAEALDRCRLRAAAHGIELAASGEAGMTIHGDEDLMVTALRNLLENAFKYSPLGSLVRIKAQVKEKTFCLSVADSGRGMTPEQVERVGMFRQFERERFEQQGLVLQIDRIDLAAAVLMQRERCAIFGNDR